MLPLAEFTAALVARLRRRPDMGGAYQLDLRHKDFGGRTPLVVRNPADPGWPARGAATSERAVAQEWVRRRYAAYLYAECAIAERLPGVADVTVREACSRYVEDVTATHGADHHTVVNRRCEIRRHIMPSFGDTPFTALTAGEVQRWIQGLEVEKPDGAGGRRRVPAKRNTRRSLLLTLRAIWRHTFGKVSCPFGTAELEQNLEPLRRRRRIKAGDVEELIREETKSLTAHQACLALVAAMYYDRELTRRPTMRRVSVPNTAALIVLLIATGGRIGELADLRWKMVREDEGYIIMPGTKTRHSLRVIPLQDVLRPWLPVLKRLAQPDGGEPPANRHVLFTDRRDPTGRASMRTLLKHVTAALRLAGLKAPGEQLDSVATHVGRRTHITWGSAAPHLVDKTSLLQYVAHDPALPAVTQGYIDQWVAEVPESHRRYIRHLLPPDEAEARLAGFAPAAIAPPRGRSGRPSPRAKDVVAEP